MKLSELAPELEALQQRLDALPEHLRAKVGMVHSGHLSPSPRLAHNLIDGLTPAEWIMFLEDEAWTDALHVLSGDPKYIPSLHGHCKRLWNKYCEAEGIKPRR